MGTTRQAILDAAVRHLERSSPASLKIAKVAEQSRVGPPTIYHYFESRSRLIAEAQLQRAIVMIDENFELMKQLDEAIDRNDEAAIAAVVEALSSAVWLPNQRDHIWTYIDILTALRSEPEVYERFQEVFATDFENRVIITKKLQAAGWMDADIDARAWVLFFQGAAFGNVLGDLAPGVAPNFASTQKVFTTVLGAARRVAV